MFRQPETALATTLAVVAALDWDKIEQDLSADGWSNLGPLLSAECCRTLAQGYDEEVAFRSRVIMARHGYGCGEYRYYAYPLPPLVQALRSAFYPRLAPIANRWRAALQQPGAFAESHEEFLGACHALGQTKPTPLLLRYGAGDFNCLHQDLYGDLHFPLQVAFLLNRPDEDFTGGEFVLTEQRPRRQSRAQVIPFAQGEAVAFVVNQRPIQGARGINRATTRHGVSRLRSGQRHTLGIIFHDAR